MEIKYQKKNTCNVCHISFDKSIVYCPQCNRYVQHIEENIVREGAGRAYGAGGEAFNNCSFCFGNANWCPFMD